MGFFFHKKTKRRHVAIFDVGSASVGAALVRIDELDGGVMEPKIMWAEREFLSYRGQVDPNPLSLATNRALKALAGRLSASARGRVEEAHCFLSSPWQIGQTRIISSEHARPVRLNDEAVTGFMSKELDRFKKEISSSYGITNTDDAEVIEQTAMSILLNGYPVLHPIDMHAKEIDIALYFSVGATSFLDSMRIALKNNGIDTDIYFHSLTFAFFDTVRDVFTEKKNFLLCDVGGEITDVSFVRDDVLVETASFPLGKNTIFRDVMKETGATFEETRSLFSLVSDDARDYTEKEVALLAAAERTWRGSFFHALESLSGGVPLPRTIFCIAGSEFLSWVSRSVEGATAESPSLYAVERLDTRFLRAFCKVLGAREDSFLMLESIFIAKILSNAEMKNNSV